MPSDWLRSLRNRLRKNSRRPSRIRNAGEHLEIRELLAATPVIIDNGDPGYYDVRTWTNSTTTGHAGDSATASSTTAGALASWTFSNLENGQYYLQATWTPGGINATNATFTARSEFGAAGREFTVNQRSSPTPDDIVGTTPFKTLGVVTVRNGSLTVELTNPYADGLVVADAVRLEPVAAIDNSVEVRTERLDAITKGLFAFQEVYGHLPPVATPTVMDANGKFPLSWRVHLLPFLGYDSLYRSFHLNEPWNSTHNLTLLNQMPDLFRSLDLPAGSGLTGFQRIDVPGGFHLTGAGGPNLNSQDITDNPATSLLLLELSADKALPWTAPDDTPYSPLDPLASISPTPTGFILAAMADGKIQRINRNISAADFHALATWNGKEILSADRLDDIFLPSTLTPDQISQNNLQKILLGMSNFQEVYGSFPPGEYGLYSRFYDANQNPYLSWRVHILRFIGEEALYEKFHIDEPWDSPNNLPLADLMPDVFRSIGISVGSSLTGYQILNGPGAYDTHGNPRLTPYRHILDGKGNTLAVVELPAASAKLWTRPDADVSFNSADPLAGIAPIPADGLWSIMFDGSIRKISSQITPQNMAALASWAGGEVQGASELTNSFLDFPFPESIDSRRLKLNQLAQAFSFFLNYFLPVNAPRSHFDASGKPYLSWRVYLLPYLGYSSLYDQFHFEEPWNSPHNFSLLDKMPEVFRTRGLPVGTYRTGFQLLTGPDAYLQGTPDYSYGHGPSINFNTDGSETTLLVLETQASQAVEWTRPDGDIPFDLNHPLNNIDLTGLENVSADGLLTLMIDGGIRTIKPSISPEDFAEIVTWRSGEIIDAVSKHDSFFDPDRVPDWQYDYRFLQQSGFPLIDVEKKSLAKMKDLAFALHYYHDVFFEFPISNVPEFFDTSGKSKLSWRVHLLPFIGEQNLYNQFHLDEPWDSPNNLPLLDRMPEIFRTRGLPVGTNLTGIQFVSSPDSFNPVWNKSQSVLSIYDGTSLTIGAIETPPELAVPWTKPDDLPFNPTDPFGNIRSLVSDYIVAMMMDGSVRAFSPSISPVDAAALITWNGGDSSPYLDYYNNVLSLTPQIQLTDSASNRYRIETDVAQFGSTNYPSALLKTFTIKNTGSQPLVISAVGLPLGYNLHTPIPTIAPGASAPLTIRLQGAIGGDFGGLVTLVTNVPDQPLLKFRIDGNVLTPLTFSISQSSIAENLPADSTVGIFATTDPTPGGTFLYSLVPGIGSTDNSLFTIDSSGNLKANAPFNFEARSSYSIRVRTTRQGGGPALEQSFTISVSDVNDAPVLNPNGNPTLDPITLNVPNANNPGTLVSDIIASMSPSGGITDPDTGALQGIAVNGLTATANGTWQFTTDGGTTWTPFGPTGNANGRLLAANALTRIRYVPNIGFLGEAKLAFVAWDQTAGTNGNTAAVGTRGGTTPYSATYEYASIFVRNSAPILNNNGNPTLDPITLNIPNANNPGTLVSDLIARMSPNGGITDPNPNSLQGIAINGLTNTANGTWEFTVNNGTNWTPIGTTGNSNARLLAADPNTRIRYRPNAGFLGEAKLAFVAWDRTTGANGGIANVNNRGGSTPYSLSYDYASIFVVNSAPVLTPTNASYLDSIPMNVANAANIGTLVSDLITRIGPNGITDPNPAALQGIAINGLTGTTNGTWQYTTNGGTSWSNINTTGNSNARLLAANPNTRIRFVPNLNFTGTVKLAFVAWDQTTGINGSIANVASRGGSTPYSLNYDYASLRII